MSANNGRLKWHCRRALLELDLIFQRFWEKQGDVPLDAETEATFMRLVMLEDHDLWELVSGRQTTEDPQINGLIARLMTI